LEKISSGMILGLALALACAIATSVSFLLKQRGAASAPPVRVSHPLRSATALTSVAANLVAIVGGVLIFRDSIGTGAVAIAGRMIAFGLVIAGAALIPAPLRVAGSSELPQTPAPRKPQRC
jgi:hypothetical protein